MDKHERKQLRKRDEKLGKIKELYTASFSETEYQKKQEVFDTLRDYQGRLIPNFVSFALKYEDTYSYNELRWAWNNHNGFSRWGFRYLLEPYSMYRTVESGKPIWGQRINTVSQVWLRSIGDNRLTYEHLYRQSSWDQEDHIAGKRVLVYRGNFIDVRASIRNGKELIDKRLSMVRAYELLRTKERTQKLRNELLAEYNRLRPILNFKHIKEELMMTAWHPKRIERILELGGWDALDNFAGC